jgi:hypothetical protein
MNIASNKFHYFVTFVDTFSRMTWLFLMKDRSELFSVFQIFCNMIKIQFSQKICILYFDNAKEYTYSSFAFYLSDKGIIHQISCAHTPQQNGVAKRKNCHLLDVVHCLLIHMHVPKHFWSDAILTANYVINWMPSSILDGASPHSLIYSSSPPFALLFKVFGCVSYVHNLGLGYDKLDPPFTKCVILGNSTTQKGYRCYSPVLRHYFISTDVMFVEFFPIFLLMRLLKSLPLSLMSHLFRCLFHISLSLSCCLHALLLLSRFIHVGQSHQLLHLHRHSSHLRICCHLHLIPCPLPYKKVHVLALLNILSVSLYPFVLYLLPILALFPIFLLFPPQRQCKMPYLTLDGGKLWNWK